MKAVSRQAEKDEKNKMIWIKMLNKQTKNLNSYFFEKSFGKEKKMIYWNVSKPPRSKEQVSGASKWMVMSDSEDIVYARRYKTKRPV
jgi:hypothetical protein